jgi:excisionase family DNA binding protein
MNRVAASDPEVVWPGSVTDSVRERLLGAARGRAVISIVEAADLLDIPRTCAYDSAKRGTLPSIRLGRRIVVPIAALEKMLLGG